MERTLGGKGKARAYADDIAVVLQSFWSAAPAVAALFQEYGDISNLKLSISKCVMVPLWPSFNQASVFRLVLEHVPTWNKFLIRERGKYLGFWIGPGAGDHSWDAPLAKYTERCHYIASFGVGLWFTVHLYKVFALSVLSFVAQLQRLPESVLEAEERMFRVLVKGPGNWTCKDILWNLDNLFKLPSGFPSLKLFALAAQWRICECEVPDFLERYKELQQWRYDDDSIF